MNVIFFSPGFPAEMPLFVRGLAQIGARVFGIGDQPRAALDREAQQSLTEYLQVGNLLDEQAVLGHVRPWLRGKAIDRIECLWEPGMILAARLRETLGVPGMSVAQTVPFRDKEKMKQVLDAAGLRTPRHGRARTTAEVWATAERIGFPLIVKPIAGAGSKDTYRCNDRAELEHALPRVKHVAEVSVEEYIDGEEHTFDTVCVGGRILFENCAWYRPKPMVMAHNPWISPQSICLRDIERPEIKVGRDLGHQVLRALGFDTGFTHMEWYRTPAGEAVFGEIGGRPPGARLVHGMNYAHDTDLFVGWAEAVCHGRLTQPTAKKYNCAVIFKRAQGEGRISRIEGMPSLLARYGEHIAYVELNQIGQPKRDARDVIIGDGWVAVRHPNLEYTLEIADAVGTDLRLYAD